MTIFIHCPHYKRVFVAILAIISFVRAFRVHQPQHLKAAPCLQMMQVWCDCRTSSKEPPNLDQELDLVVVDSDDSSCPSSLISVLVQDDDNRLTSREDKSVVGTVVNLENVQGQNQAMAALGSVEWILVSSSSWQMIPAENLIAAAQSSGTKLAFVCKDSSDVGGLARALELGVDALCVDAAAPVGLWEAVFKARAERRDSKCSTSAQSNAGPVIITGSCWRRQTSNTILADRICVDLVQTLSTDEGCWVGSSAKTMALILSEAASSQFVPTRPFRVNAGPVHSYILMSDLTTKYLCELEPSDQVLVHNASTGKSRAVAVGRLKQEVRPCVLVELETDKGRHAQVILQQAETVRLGLEGGDFVRVTDLEASSGNADVNKKERVLLRITSSGTHVGKRYDGTVLER